MAEDHRVAAEGAASGPGESGLGGYFRGGGIQAGEDEESAGEFSWCRMSEGRSVPARGQSEQKGPQLQALMPLEGAFVAVCFEFGIMQVADFANIRRFPAAC